MYGLGIMLQLHFLLKLVLISSIIPRSIKLVFLTKISRECTIAHN
jgi:hypothetical protein